MVRSLVVVALLALAGAACSRVMTKPPDAVPPVKHDFDVDRLFVVIVEPKPRPEDGCRLTLYPDNQMEADVRMRPGWTVGWTLVNRCSNLPQHQTLALAFTHESAGPKSPIAFRPFRDRSLIGKVRAAGLFGNKCQREDEDAPCGRYTYTVTVGDLKLDPDIEIVDYHP
jgi:hypothetical protein